MTTSDTSRFVRLQVELVLEVTDAGQLGGAALTRIEADDSLPAGERMHAESMVREDAAEALAYLVEPSDLIKGVPGVELSQASWTSETIDYDPDANDWDPYADEADETDHADDADDEGAGGDGFGRF